MPIQTTTAERREALPLQNRAAPVTTVDAEARTVEVVWTTGATVRRRRYTGWDSYVDYDEILVVSPRSIDLSRLERGAPVLDSHASWGTRNQLAVVERAWIEDGKGLAVLRFPARGIDEDIDRFFALVADGQRRNISVGYSVDKVRVEAGEKKGDVEQWFVERWTPHELSFVTIPADIDAQVRRGTGPTAERAATLEFPVIITRQAEPGATQEAAMADPVEAAPSAAPSTVQTDTRQTETRAAPPAPPAPVAQSVDVAAERAAAAAAERARAAEIRSIARRYKMPDDFVDNAINTDMSVRDFRDAVLDKLADTSDRTAGPTGTSVQVGRQDEQSTRREAMAEAIAGRLARAAGERGVNLSDAARTYAEMQLPEMAAECIGHRGLLRTARDVTEVLERAFHTTSDFPAIFIDALNTRLLARYQSAAPTYRRFSTRQTAPDFRPTNVVRAGDFPALQPVNEAGEIKNGTFSESKELFSVLPYGISFNITRQMIVNDQLMAIDQMLGSAGERVTDWENAKVFSELLSGGGAGPVLLTDNKRVFHADHGNLAGSGAAIDVTSVGSGRAAMMKQTTLDGIKANFTPTTLLVGPDKLTQAEQLLTAITPPEQAKAIPESLRRLVPVGDANIPGNAWYLFADPAIAPVFVYGYLDGFEGPRLTTEATFSVQGMKVKLEHDFGVSAIDYRGGYRNAGA